MRAIVTILIVLSGFAAAALALGQHLALAEARQLMAGGAQATGTITQQTGERKGNSRYCSYRFRVGDREVEATRRAIPWAARELPIGSTVPVRYEAKDPAKSITAAELEELEGWGNRLLFPVMSALLLALAIARIVRRKER